VKRFSLTWFDVSTVLVASISCSLAVGASDFQVELALSCSEATSVHNKLAVVTAEGMIDLAGPQACIDSSTRIPLTATAVRTYKNKFQSVSVELTLTPESSAQWIRLQREWLGKEWVLMRGQRSLLYARIFNESHEQNLTVLAKDELEAEQIAPSLRGNIGGAQNLWR